MWLDVSAMAVLLTLGNLKFRHFEPQMPLWRRVLKVVLLLGLTAIVSFTSAERVSSSYSVWRCCP
ncbi:MAG: hypothetical protein JWP63_6078 [Candidatus Solibacter sp.]|jgi:hypothetical protein|nr:hypothetical protein [Candidatus Solibacter sp.]